MLREDMTLRRLMKPQPSQVNCQMMQMHRYLINHRIPCGLAASHVVVTRADAWRAVCPMHAEREPNLGVAGKSFVLTYDADACPHAAVVAVDDDWECSNCGELF